MNTNRGTKRTYHQLDNGSPATEGGDYHHFSSSSVLSLSSPSTHIQLVRDPEFMDVHANLQSNRDLSNREITLRKSNPSSTQQFEDLKRLRVFYKVFEVVNKLSVSLGDERAANDSELLRKREMVTKLLKAFSEAHLAVPK